MTAAVRGVLGRTLVLIGVASFACDSEQDRPMADEVFDFSELVSSSLSLAPELRFTARDGATLGYRRYGEDAPVELILVHGSSAESSYLSSLAAAIAESGAANVTTPDLRGHGSSPERRGDIEYIDQLEDDLADLIGILRGAAPEARVVIGGHSSGGGLAIRFAGSPHADLVDGYLLLAPFLRHDAPTTRPDAGGWAAPKLARIIAITILNGFGVTALNGVSVLEFNLPDARRQGNETLAYSFRMMTGFNPRDYQSDLDALCAPALLLVGSEDEAFVPQAFAPVFAAHAPQTRVEVIPGAKHLGIVEARPVAALAVAWLRGLASGALADRCP
jgi:alpha-beta hydrolase superfamily lysophospholipase